MKKWLPLIVIGILVFYAYSSGKGFYNSTIKLN